MKHYHTTITKELNRILPYHLLGVVLHSIVIYLAFKIPECIGNILDMLMQSSVNKELVFQEVYWLIFYSSVVFIPRTIYRTFYFTFSRKADTYLRKKVIEHLQKVKPEYFETESKGAFLAYLSNEILSIHKVLGNFWFWMTKIVVAPMMAVVLIWNQFNKSLALWLIPAFPIAILAMWYHYKKLKEKIEKSRQVYVELSKNIEKNTDGFLLIKSYNRQKEEMNQFKQVNQEMYQADYEIGIAKNKISNVINLLYGFCYIVGFAVGVIYFQKGIITAGGVTAFIGYIGQVLADFVPSIQKFLERMPYMKQSLNRFDYFLNLEEYQQKGKKLEPIRKIEIRHLSYWYPNEEKPALNNINLTIRQGEKIGIVGQVGSGKTTLMNIITGLYEIPDGMVFINDEDINQYQKDTIFEKFNYALQKNVMLDDTIKSNINLTENIGEKELYKMIEKAELKEEIENLKEKENTFIGEKGIKLSGGQKQRISIARNLSTIRDINIFDDTLSALDSNTEKKIMSTLRKEIDNKTMIVISNKISNLKDLDKIYILLDGKIEDFGTHQELLKRNEFYQELEWLEGKEKDDEEFTKEKC